MMNAEGIEALEARISDLERRLAEAKDVIRSWGYASADLSLNAAVARAENRLRKNGLWESLGRGLVAGLLGKKYTGGTRARTAAANAHIAKEVADEKLSIAQKKREAQELARNLQKQLSVARQELKVLVRARGTPARKTKVAIVPATAAKPGIFHQDALPRLNRPDSASGGVSVTQRVKQVKQPRGGYVKPKAMEVRQLEDGHPSPLDLRGENISPALVGSVVDYLTRLANGAKPRDAFRISLKGAQCLGGVELARAQEDADSLASGRVDALAIAAACRLANYDVALRAGPGMYNPNAQTRPDATSIEHISIMVQRSFAFFCEYGPVVLDGFSFVGGYTGTVMSGDGDFLTADTLWDFKVSVNGPTKEHTLQLLMYWLMGSHSVNKARFTGISHLGVFNPRLNRVYRIALNAISGEVMTEVTCDVIGYPIARVEDISPDV